MTDGQTYRLFRIADHRAGHYVVSKNEKTAIKFMIKTGLLKSKEKIFFSEDQTDRYAYDKGFNDLKAILDKKKNAIIELEVDKKFNHLWQIKQR